SPGSGGTRDERTWLCRTPEGAARAVRAVTGRTGRGGGHERLRRRQARAGRSGTFVGDGAGTGPRPWRRGWRVRRRRRPATGKGQTPGQAGRSAVRAEEGVRG